MDYKVIIANQGVAEETITSVFETLQQMVINGKNIDMNNPVPFIVEGQSADLIGTTWGTSYPHTEDIENLSAHYHDLTFHVIQASRILNGKHFEDLTHYSMFVYQDGSLREVLKPEPIVWKSVKVIEVREGPWD